MTLKINTTAHNTHSAALRLLNFDHRNFDHRSTLIRAGAFLGPSPHTYCSMDAVWGCSMAKFTSTPTSFTLLTISISSELLSLSRGRQLCRGCKCRERYSLSGEAKRAVNSCRGSWALRPRDTATLNSSG